MGYPEAMLPGEAIPKRVGLHWQEQGSDDQSINQSDKNRIEVVSACWKSTT